MTNIKSTRVSKAEWLEKALHVLETEGAGAVKVEKLARMLGIAKSGFYWHFKNRQDLRKQMLNYWMREYTEVVIAKTELLQGNPEQRLEQVMNMIQEFKLNKLDLAIRAWALSDPMAAQVLNNVYKIRLDFIRGLFKEMGFRGDELEMRTQLFVCYQSWEHSMFAKQPKAKRNKLLKLRHAFFTRQ